MLYVFLIRLSSRYWFAWRKTRILRIVCTLTVAQEVQHDDFAGNFSREMGNPSFMCRFYITFLPLVPFVYWDTYSLYYSRKPIRDKTIWTGNVHAINFFLIHLF